MSLTNEYKTPLFCCSAEKEEAITNISTAEGFIAVETFLSYSSKWKFEDRKNGKSVKATLFIPY